MPGALRRVAIAEDSAPPEVPDDAPRLRRGSSFVGAVPGVAPEEPAAATSVRPALRRGAAGARRESPVSGAASGAEVGATNALPRAGTFAFGSGGFRGSLRADIREQSVARATDKGTGKPVGPDVWVPTVEGKDAGSGDVFRKGEVGGRAEVCGMCGSCGVGLKGMPPWAPERLKVMRVEERAVVMAEMHQKEEMGRLEAELRRKSLKDRLALEELEISDGGGTDITAGDVADGGSAGPAENAHFSRVPSTDVVDADGSSDGNGDSEVVGKVDDGATMAKRGDLVDVDRWRDGHAAHKEEEIDGNVEEYAEVDDDLESVDLGTEKEFGSGQTGSSRSIKRRSRSRSRSTVETQVDYSGDFNDDISCDVHDAHPRSRVPLTTVVDCSQCDGLETKVRDLEEQLDVLREVVKMSADPEGAAAGDADGEQERADDARKKGRSWKDKVMSAYYGSASAASERTRLREEVEALRKATDFLFNKLQQADEANSSAAAEQ